MRKNKLLPALMLILFMVALVIPAEGSNFVEVQNSRTELKIRITFANYTDADADGLEDDVIGQWEITAESSKTFIYYELDITLTLPSGNQFFVYLGVLTTEGTIYYTIYMYNTATEPGWYDFEVTGRLLYPNIAEGTALYEFDPPEGPGGDPT